MTGRSKPPEKILILDAGPVFFAKGRLTCGKHAVAEQDIAGAALVPMIAGKAQCSR
jgi:hypothetical protein